MSKPNYKNKNERPKNGGRKPNYRSKNGNKTKYADECDDKKQPGDVNNPGYYYENTTVLDQVMNFSFNEYGNVPVDVELDTGSTLQSYNPMVISYYLNPSVPQTDGNLSPLGNPELNGVTTAALRNYTYLCGSNNKTTLYPPQVVILVTLAVSSLVSYASWLSRNMGIAYLYNYRNRAYPDMLYKAAGIDADDMRANLAAYRVRFNTLLAVANRIPFPASINCIAKSSEIYGSIYLDDDNSTLAQSYVFNPSTVWTYNETYDTNGSGLDTTTVYDGTKHNFSHYLDIFENMISALLNSTALNAVYSDVIRLVQTGKLTGTLVFNPIPENFTVIPVYNKEIETWIHNAIIVNHPSATASIYDPASTGKFTNLNDVTSSPNTNTIHYHPQFVLLTEYNHAGIIDFDHDNVSVEDKVMATRFAFRCTTLVNGTSIYSDDIALMDFYITGAIVFLSSDWSVPNVNIPTSKYDLATYTKPQTVTMLSAISRFDWAPLLYIVNGTSGIDTIGDMDYYTQIDYQTLKKIYDYEVIHYLQIS